MPKQGYATITVSEEVYEELKRFADETSRTIPKAIEHLMKVAREHRKEEA